VAYWKGYLKLSLVSCPIALYPPSSEREKISFHQLNKATGNRIKYQKVDAATGDVVEGDDGDDSKGEYIELQPEELEAIALEYLTRRLNRLWIHMTGGNHRQRHYSEGFLDLAGTVLAAMALNEVKTFDSAAQAKRNLRTAIENVAAHLGNTPTICRKCYVHPDVLTSYLDGKLVLEIKKAVENELRAELSGLQPEEAAVLAMLRGRLAKEVDREHDEDTLASTFDHETNAAPVTWARIEAGSRPSALTMKSPFRARSDIANRSVRKRA
jgi:hypothetical protein